MENIFINDKYNKTYVGEVLEDISGTIGNSPFKGGEKVYIAIALTKNLLESKIREEIIKWKSQAGAQSVMCDDVPNIYEVFAEKILNNENYFNVWVVSQTGRKDYSTTFEEGKKLFKCIESTLKIKPENVVSNAIDYHNDRVF